MAELKMSFETIDSVDRIVFRENLDRNGPGMVIQLANKNAFRAAVNRITAQGDEEIVEGDMGRIENWSSNPVAMFQVEADADAYVTDKGAGFIKETRTHVIGGFNCIVNDTNENGRH